MPSSALPAYTTSPSLDRSAPRRTMSRAHTRSKITYGTALRLIETVIHLLGAGGNGTGDRAMDCAT